MELSPQYTRGAERAIYALVLDDGSCPALDYLANLEVTNKAAQKTLVRRYINHSERGPTHNTQHRRKIEGYENLHEFKAPQKGGARLTYSEFSDDRTVLLTGFSKLKRKAAEAEYERANRLVLAYTEQECRDAC